MSSLGSKKRSSHYLLLGADIKKSISPVVQNAAFRGMGVAGVYELYEIPQAKFEQEMKRIMGLRDVRGFNITAPFKEAIIPYLAKLDSRSKAIGAVNTVKITSGGRMLGYNTDVDGILASLEKLRAERGSKCLILGAGGAARACLYTVLKSRYDSVSILNRTIERAQKMCVEFQLLFPKANIESEALTSANFEKNIQDTDLLINAVTNPFPFEPNFTFAPKNLKLLDLGYKKPSVLLIRARRAGVRSIDGSLMLVAQAARSFEIWTGRKAPIGDMLSAAKRRRPRSSVLHR
jgi:shikimate dehydrogenase